MNGERTKLNRRIFGVWRGGSVTGAHLGMAFFDLLMDFIDGIGFYVTYSRHIYPMK